MHGEYRTTSVEETHEIARNVTELVKEGGILCLFGDLGSGKTTFTQGLAKSLGIEHQVNSPTFLIVRTYTVPGTEVIKSFYHIDLYRLQSEAEMEDMGLPEILSNMENIVVIEWSEKLKKLLPTQRIELHFSYIDEHTRKIEVRTYA